MLRLWRTGPLAWSLWSTSVLFGVAALILLAVGWSAPEPSGAFGVRGYSVILGVSFGTVGVMVATRRPSNPIGWIPVRGEAQA